LPGFLPPSNKLARVVPDANVLLDLGYVVISPQLISDPARGLGLVGTPQTSYRVEARLPAAGKDEWTPVAEITLEAGTNWLPNVSGTDATGRVHRAVWLSE